MPKSKSSKRWLAEHFRDPHVQRARKEGFRSRAAYKLLEIHQKAPIFKKGMIVIDLGAAPGGWSQVAKEKMGGEGLVLAVDLLPMDPIPGVEFIEGDFTEEAFFKKMVQRLGGKAASLVLSDMSPNMSGISEVDQANAMRLTELALDFARGALEEGGGFLCKLFQGVGYEAMVREVRKYFRAVKILKPTASRARSREVYILGQGYFLHEPRFTSHDFNEG